MILRFFREFESYYPELLHSCYILNSKSLIGLFMALINYSPYVILNSPPLISAPLVFSYIFNLVKPLLSSHTLSKVQLFDYNREKWAPALKQALPNESIPVEYGGTGEKIFQT